MQCCDPCCTAHMYTHQQAMVLCMQARCGCYAQPMHLSTDASLSEQLDAESAKAEVSGKPMKAIIICNPNNPTGEVIPPEVLQEYLTWCCEHDVHLIR